MSIAELTGIDVPTGLLIGGDGAPGARRSRHPTPPQKSPSRRSPMAPRPTRSTRSARRTHALPAGAATLPRQRAELLRKAFELTTARSEQFARLMSAENGKSLRDARGEATYAAEFFRWYAEEAVRIEGTLMRAPSGANKILTMHQPIGVSLLVTPWNFPAAMATRKIGLVLAAGLLGGAQACRGHPADRARAGRAAQRGGGARRRGQRGRHVEARPGGGSDAERLRESASSRSPGRPRSACCCSARRPSR